MGRLDLRDPYRDEDFDSGIEVVHRQQSEDVSLAASLRERGRGAGRVDAPALSVPRDLGGDTRNPDVRQVRVPLARGGAKTPGHSRVAVTTALVLSTPLRFFRSLKQSARISGGSHAAKSTRVPREGRLSDRRLAAGNESGRGGSSRDRAGRTA